MIDDPEQTLQDFFDKIDVWIQSANFLKSKVPLAEVDPLLNLTEEEISGKSTESLMTGCYRLYGYIDSLQEVYNREKSILEYCEESIWRIISPTFNDYGDQYTKWEYKYNSAVRENPLAKKVNQLKIATRARLSSLDHRIEHVKRRADILFEIARRRKNEHYNH
jgi:hypothetical protein